MHMETYVEDILAPQQVVVQLPGEGYGADVLNLHRGHTKAGEWSRNRVTHKHCTLSAGKGITSHGGVYPRESYWGANTCARPSQWAPASTLHVEAIPDWWRR